VMRVSTIKPAMAARKYHWRARACRNTAKGSARRHSMIGGREKRSTNDQDRPGNVAHIERARGTVAACVVTRGPKHQKRRQIPCRQQHTAWHSRKPHTNRLLLALRGTCVVCTVRNVPSTSPNACMAVAICT
jgi:hypothetical protein